MNCFKVITLLAALLANFAGLAHADADALNFYCHSAQSNVTADVQGIFANVNSSLGGTVALRAHLQDKVMIIYQNGSGQLTNNAAALSYNGGGDGQITTSPIRALFVDRYKNSNAQSKIEIGGQYRELYPLNCWFGADPGGSICTGMSMACMVNGHWACCPTGH